MKHPAAQTEALELLSETFVRSAAPVLSERLRAAVSLRPEAARILPHRESAPATAACVVFEAAPLSPVACLDIDLPIALFAVDRALGGPAEAEARPFPLTATGRAVLADLSLGVLESWLGALRSVAGFSPRVASVEGDPRSARIAAPEAPLAVLSFAASVGPVAGQLRLRFPLDAAAELLARLPADYRFPLPNPPQETPAEPPADAQKKSRPRRVRDRAALAEFAERDPAFFASVLSAYAGRAVPANPYQRCALMLIALPEPLASRIIALLDRRLQESLLFEIARIELPGTADLDGAVADFDAALGDAELQGGIDLARRLYEEALGAQTTIDMVNALTDAISAPISPFDFIGRFDPLHVAAFFAEEHPQATALALRNLDREKAELVLALLPQELRSEVSARTAGLADVECRIVRAAEKAAQTALEALESGRLVYTGEAPEGAAGTAASDLGPLLGADRRALRRALAGLGDAELAAALLRAEPDQRETCLRSVGWFRGLGLRRRMEFLDRVASADPAAARRKILDRIG